MISSFKILFRINLFHQYFRDGKNKEFSITPSEETARLFQKYGLIFKVSDASVIILVKVDQMLPFVAIPQDCKFSFYITIDNPSFLTVTSINSALLSDHIFYFSNYSGNLNQSELHLSLPVDSFNLARTYIPGEFVNHSGGEIFECIKACRGIDVDITENWISRGKNGYVSDKDLVAIYPAKFNYTCSTPSSTFDLKIYGINSTTGILNKLLDNQITTSADSSLQTSIAVDCSMFGPGYYRININGEDAYIYADDSAVKQKVNGIIEIFSSIPANNPYSLFDNFGRIKNIAYSILYANRRAFWKYIPALKTVNGIFIKDNHETTSPFTGHSDSSQRIDYFVSNVPLLLSENSDINCFDIQHNNVFFPAPKPDPVNSAVLTQTFDKTLNKYTDYYCTMYVNY